MAGVISHSEYRMNLDSLLQLKKGSNLEKIERVACERGITGVDPHFNISVKNGESSTNFNVFEKDADLTTFVQEWAVEAGLDILVREVEISETVFSEFNNEKLPEDETVIWRYMDLSKFLSMITTGSLWFARLDKNWEVDPLEGKVPKLQWELIESRIQNTNFAPKYTGNGKVQSGGEMEAGMSLVSEETVRKEHLEIQKNQYELTTYNSYVTCWNLSKHESYHMWKLYCGHHNGIAIKSTVGRLSDSFGKNKNFSVLGGVVEYLDHEKGVPKNKDNLLSHVFCKSLPYSFESELRLCIHDHGFTNDVIGDLVPYSIDVEEVQSMLSNYQSGFNVGVDLESLIEEIVISPYADPWFRDMVKSLISRNSTFHDKTESINLKLVSESSMKVNS
ncbi:MAG: DUF2971 domain-containing protein [Oleispira sp.]|nr:DUF2971 domain-containing protein [Oleispira sp.]MBL4881366.1 DUF2971 domain-containing protein [Oleispira sp.]